ncbi:MAG: hypothetical protein IT380_24060 [Myxococcales bacterium]|nr:hypothetical protein [Myxococcales bacterium]
MGLDWLVGARPVKEREQEGFALLERTLADPKNDAPSALWEAFPKVDSWSELGAPRVGFDPEADAWFVRTALRQGVDTGAPPSEEERRWLQKNAGYTVLALAPPCDGLPVYSNAPLMRELELTSFRGQFLKDAVHVIGEQLFERAHANMLPGPFLAFGEELERRGRAFAEAEGVVAEAARRERPLAPENSPASVAHIIASAARWCLFWAKRGHWLNTWW